MPIDPACDVKFYAFKLGSLDILSLIARSFFTENMADALRARVEVCLIGEVYILPEAFDYFVLMVFIIFNTCCTIYTRNLLLYIDLLKASTSFYMSFKSSLKSTFSDRKVIIFDLTFIGLISDWIFDRDELLMYIVRCFFGST